MLFRLPRPQCQREHWKSTHKDTCRASVHLNKDLKIYANFTKESPAAVVDLQRLAYPGHLLRAEADKKWEKKDWEGAAGAYGRALQSIKDTKEQAQIVAKDHGLELMFQNIAKFQFEQNGARIKSNLVACHLQLAIPKLEKIIRGPKGQATDGDRLVALIKHFEIGPGEGLSFLDDIFKGAREAMCEDDGVGYHWWKLHYRDAQLYHCTLRYEKAMEYIGRARDLINQKESSDGAPLLPGEEAKARTLVDALEVEVKKVVEAMTGSSSLPSKDGIAQQVLGNYFASGYTPLGEISPNIPIDTCKEEILAVRLLAAADDSVKIAGAVTAKGGGVMGPGLSVNHQYADQARDLLNKILTIVAQPLFLLFPASGSGERAPPISVHLLAFYFRACLSKTGMKKLKIEDFCEEATAWLSDEMAYAIASHAFEEVEEAHNPTNGHAKKLGQTGMGGCMPCACRIVRSGVTSTDWADGLQMAAHGGRIEWLCFALNRLLEGASDKSIYDIILERDEQGCSTIMHTANDVHSKLSGLTLRLLSQAVAFSTPNSEEKRAKVRAILESEDTWGMFPALAAVSLNNTVALAAFADLGARFWDDDAVDQPTSSGITNSMKSSIIQQAGTSGNETMKDLVKAIKANADGRNCCAFCGKSPRGNAPPLQACSKCGRALYCDEDCQGRAYGKHKFVCTTAEVQQSEAWFSQNISMPKP